MSPQGSDYIIILKIKESPASTVNRLLPTLLSQITIICLLIVSTPSAVFLAAWHGIVCGAKFYDSLNIEVNTYLILWIPCLSLTSTCLRECILSQMDQCDESQRQQSCLRLPQNHIQSSILLYKDKIQVFADSWIESLDIFGNTICYILTFSLRSVDYRLEFLLCLRLMRSMPACIHKCRPYILLQIQFWA